MVTPSKLPAFNRVPDAGEPGGGQDGAAPAPDGALLEGSSSDLQRQAQFYKWHSDIEASMKLETEEKYRQYVNALTAHLRTCDQILSEVDSTLGLFTDLQSQHRAVAEKTKSLHDACERLDLRYLVPGFRVSETEVVIVGAGLAGLAAARALARASVPFVLLEASDGVGGRVRTDAVDGYLLDRGFQIFLTGLLLLLFARACARACACACATVWHPGTSYVGANLQYADSSTYLVKFRQLQSRALGMVRSHLLSCLRQASAQVQAAIKEALANSSTPGQVTISEGSETNFLIVKFKTNSGNLKVVMEEIEGRAARKEYEQLLHDCHSVYCEQRLSLVCQQEHQLFDHFFPASSAESSNLSPLIDPLGAWQQAMRSGQPLPSPSPSPCLTPGSSLKSTCHCYPAMPCRAARCTALYDTLRPRIIHEADLDLLCELVDILRAEVLDEQLQRRGDTCAGLRPTVMRTLADVQERLIFRGQTYMRDEITNYQPSAEELDYPNKLIQAAAAATPEPLPSPSPSPCLTPGSSLKSTCHCYPAMPCRAARCTALYDTLRPRIIHEADLDLLCELVDILRAEVLDEQLQRRGDTCAGLRPTVMRTLADVQERLIFRGQTYMRDEITNYQPSAEELDYPNKLIQAAAAATPETEEEGGDGYAVWYPPLEKTLACLSKLYRCVDSNTFTGLAQEAVAVCSSSIERASKVVSRKSSAMDGQLFLIKHLLILREQIAPFDIEFAVTVKELDFSHMLAGLFSFGNSSSIARLSPRVTENRLDAKKELEKTLKATCEQFIMSITKLTVEPMLSFITKVTAIRKALANIKGPDGGDAPARSLRDQAFAAPEKVKEIVAKVDEALKNILPEVAYKMKLYLQNGSTRAILFKPIKYDMDDLLSLALQDD
eukprot:jgi/Mesen1/10091/ME000074S09433